MPCDLGIHVSENKAKVYQYAVSLGVTPELSDAGGLSECEGKTTSNHAKVVVWTIHYIPTKIVYPAEMRCKAHFDATAKLPHAPGFGAG